MQRTEWERLNGHKGGVLWFTGLSGSGKTTIARATEKELMHRGIRCIVLDGDQLRSGLNQDLGFSEEDRKENLRRAAEVAKLFYEKGFVVLLPMISPLAAVREHVRTQFDSDSYAEVYIQCSLEACEIRDPKGLYRRARAGEIIHFTGIDSIYEPPVQPEITLNTERDTLSSCVHRLVQYITQYCGLQLS